MISETLDKLLKNKILIHGDAKSIPLPRDNGGRFLKGFHYNRETELKKGEHWRQPKDHWDKEWLHNEYVTKQKSAKEIAKKQKCRENNIRYFLQKFNIKLSKKVLRIKKKKYALVGEKNPMYGRCGELSPMWNGGNSPERQKEYGRFLWKEIAKLILKRDNYRCKKCNIDHNTKNKLIVHHIKEWSRYPELRFDKNNLITLCNVCHKEIHSKIKRWKVSLELIN